MRFSALYRDARYFQIVFQFAFLFYGLLFLEWAFTWDLYLSYFLSAIASQYLFELIRQRKFISVRDFSKGLPSPIITALGLCLLLKTNNPLISVFASVLSIGSKYLFRVNGKHLFNPSAFGITGTILLTREAWLSPAQWGSTTLLLFFICVLGYIVVTRVQKLDVSLAFLLSYAFLLFFRQVLFLGWPSDFFIKSISSGSLLLFTFFMISDPKTSPHHPFARLIWGMLIGILAFVLSGFYFVNSAPIWILVPAGVVVPIFNRCFKARSFEWQISDTKTDLSSFIRFKIPVY